MPSDNPFAEPDDSDRTQIIRPVPGGRQRASPQPAAPDAFATPPAQVSGPAEMVRVGGSPLLVAAAPLLQLLSRLRNTLSQPDSGVLRERAVSEVRRFEQASREAGVPIDQLRPAHYALCASLDDVVQATPWGSQGAWASRSLVSTFHQEVRSGDRFFDVLNQVKQNPGVFLPVLELMYLCLSLGFQGRYRLSPRGPAELDRMREDVYSVIARQRPRPDPELSPHWRGVAAPYRAVRAELPVWIVGAAGLLIIGALYAWTSFGLNEDSDALFARMMAAPPAQMPAIVRAMPVQPPAPSPPPAAPGALDRLRGFLRPEIEQGLVAVIGTDAIPVVRIRNRGMFGSGSAVLQTRFTPLLERIGKALSDERGAVQVIGYTDNQPIRSVQFPSNFQLSTERAKSAASIINRGIGSTSRVSTEGRANADPIGNNATPEGREENRRIEVVLRREG
ncbi:MAG: type secretion system protein ImpK [Acetobacteraceae bacterium]|nr:type secretion system protein ImpK [Acetobacteraceae bacterium]